MSGRSFIVIALLVIRQDFFCYGTKWAIPEMFEVLVSAPWTVWQALSIRLWASSVEPHSIPTIGTLIFDLADKPAEWFATARTNRVWGRKWVRGLYWFGIKSDNNHQVCMLLLGWKLRVTCISMH